VFGADEILWVEGQTEQECFPHLLNFSGVPPRSGLSIVAVRATGDFETGRVKAAAIWEIYDRLSRGNALLAPAVAFSFDREGRSEEDIRDLQRRSGAVVHFLPRRMYENYLIAPKAIVAVVNRTAERKIAEEDVLQWLQVNGGNPIYEARNNWRNDPYDLDWLKNVRGAKLLSDLFSSLSAATVEYRKPFHSIELTEWLLEKEPDHLAGVVEYVKSLVAVD